jgi:hypothetical protein
VTYRQEFEDYHKANRGRIEALANQARTFLDYNPGSLIDAVDDSPDVNVSFVAGSLTAEDYRANYYEDRGVELPIDAVQELAENANDNQLRVAASAIAGFRLQASKYYMFVELETIDENDPEALAEFDARQPHVLSFDKALWQQYRASGPNDEEVRLTRIQLQGLEHYGSAENLVIEINDGLVEKRTTIEKVGDSLPTIITTTEASDNPLLEKTIRMLLGRNVIDKLLRIRIGRFQDEEELDDLLNGLWQAVQGTAHEEEITPVLDELRTYALAQKQSIHFIVEHGLIRPDDEQLNELEQILSGLQPL